MRSSLLVVDNFAVLHSMRLLSYLSNNNIFLSSITLSLKQHYVRIDIRFYDITDCIYYNLLIHDRLCAA